MTELEQHLLNALEKLSEDQETMFQEFKNSSEQLAQQQLEQQKFCETLQEENNNLTQSVKDLKSRLETLTKHLIGLLEQ